MPSLLKRTVVAVFGLTLFTAIANAAQAKATLETARDRMKAIAQDGGTLEKKTAAMRKLQRELLDFTYVSEQTLGDQWAKLNPKQKKDFAATLEQLVEASYLGKVNAADTADIKFGEEKAMPDGTTEVDATATAQGSEVHIVFKMKPKAPAGAQSGWLVTDVVIDDVSLVRNYRSQFQKTLAKSSFSELHAKLQKKAAELRAGDAPPPTAKNDATAKQL